MHYDAIVMRLRIARVAPHVDALSRAKEIRLYDRSGAAEPLII